VGGRGCEERVKEGEYGANTLCTCMQMEKTISVETIPGMEGGE
jgi:hypothetical protein